MYRYLMSILIIDNYDSFVHNLARYIRLIGYDTTIIRNDKIAIDKVQPFSHIILSPGPCSPDEAGKCLRIIKTYYKTKPILGICLGHQAIAQAFSATVTHAEYPMHGSASCITHTKNTIFKNIPSPLSVARYHSLIVSQNDFPHQNLATIAHCEHGEIMGIQHIKHPIFGLQFHPESILTQHGEQILQNFFTITQYTAN